MFDAWHAIMASAFQSLLARAAAIETGDASEAPAPTEDTNVLLSESEVVSRLAKMKDSGLQM